MQLSLVINLTLDLLDLNGTVQKGHSLLTMSVWAVPHFKYKLNYYCSLGM